MAVGSAKTEGTDANNACSCTFPGRLYPVTCNLYIVHSPDIGVLINVVKAPWDLSV